MCVIVFYGCWLSLIVPLNSKAFLYVSHILLFVLALSHCLYGLIELLHVSHFVLWLFAVSLNLSSSIELLLVSH